MTPKDKELLQRVSDFYQDLMLAAKHENTVEMIQVVKEIEKTNDIELMSHILAYIWGYLAMTCRIHGHFQELSDFEMISSMQKTDRMWGIV